MNGCTKRKTHRLLRPFLELQQQFPKIPHWQGADILRRLKQKEHDVDPVHPCMDTWGEYVQCLRRYGNGAVTKCKIEDARHARCLQQHGTWKPSDTLQAEKLLEMFRIFAETAHFKYQPVPIESLARGCAFPFGEKRRPGKHRGSLEGSARRLPSPSPRNR